MFKEIAIDPDVMAHWDWFLKTYDMFGFDEGRLLAEFPGKWKKMVFEKAKELGATGVNSPLSLPRMEVLMRRERFREGLFSCGREPDKEEPTWLGKATKQTPPFDAIIVESQTDSPAEVIQTEYEATDGSCVFFWEDDRFKVKRQGRVPRKADDLIAPAKKLLMKASAVRYVDPYFNPKKSEKTNPFVRLVDFLHKNSCPAKRIEVFCKLVLEDATSDDFRQELEHELPSGMTAGFCFLKEFPEGENLHPRFLLTDRGGLQYDYGLDEGKGTTIVTILDRDLRKRLWEEYSPSTSTFDRHPKCPSIELGG